MINIQNEFRDLLSLKFDEVRARNSQVSLRGFAKIVGLAPSEISLFFNKKREFGTVKMKTVLSNLKLSESEEKRFKLLMDANPTHQVYDLDEKFEYLEDQTFSIISEWYYFAILAQLELSDPPKEVEDIARRLNIKLETAKEAIDTLLKQKIITSSTDGLKVNNHYIATSSEIPSDSIKKNHKQHLELAAKALDDVAVEDRDITGITFNIDKTKMSQVKEMIKDFRRTLTIIASSDNNTESYRLSVQFFPLSKKK